MMKIKKVAALLLAAVLLLALPACSQSEEEPADKGEKNSQSAESESDGNFPVEFEEASIAAAPQRVVSLSPALTELICDLGYAQRLVGTSDTCSYEGLADLPRLGTVNAVKTDEAAALSPEVVVSVSPLSQTDRDTLEAAGAAVLVLPRAETMDELELLYQNAGRLFEGETDGLAAGQALFDAQWARVEELAVKIGAATVNKQPQAAYLRVMPLTLATGDTFEGKLLEAAGFANSAAEYSDWAYPQEKAVDLMPDVIFYDKAVGADGVKASQIYNTTPAFAANKYFEVDFDLFERQGVRMFDLLEEMAQNACPEAFA